MALAGVTLESIRVTPEVLRTKASAVQGKIREMKAAFEELERSVNRTQNYWIGEAGDVHRDFYNEQKDEIRRVFARWTEDVTDLNEIASVYAGVEKEVTSLSEDLPADVIV